MRLVEFIEMWANPFNWVRVYKEDEYYKALGLIQSGMFNWDTVGGKLDPEFSFNPKAGVGLCFLPSNVIKAKVAKFAMTVDGLLLFARIKNNS